MLHRVRVSLGYLVGAAIGGWLVYAGHRLALYGTAQDAMYYTRWYAVLVLFSFLAGMLSERFDVGFGSGKNTIRDRIIRAAIVPLVLVTMLSAAPGLASTLENFLRSTAYVTASVVLMTFGAFCVSLFGTRALRRLLGIKHGGATEV